MVAFSKEDNIYTNNNRISVMSDNVNRHTVISSGDEGSARRGS